MDVQMVTMALLVPASVVRIVSHRPFAIRPQANAFLTAHQIFMVTDAGIFAKILA